MVRLLLLRRVVVVLYMAGAAMEAMRTSSIPAFAEAYQSSPSLSWASSPQPVAAGVDLNSFSATAGDRGNVKGVEEEDGDDKRAVPTGSNPLHNR